MFTVLSGSRRRASDLVRQEPVGSAVYSQQQGSGALRGIHLWESSTGCGLGVEGLDSDPGSQDRERF